MGNFVPAVDKHTRVVNYTSVSALAMGDPTQEGGCERKWFQRYVLGYKMPENAAQKKGTGGHKQIEHFLKTGEDVLGPAARKGKIYLPEPGPDLLVEWGANDKPKQVDEMGNDIFFPHTESILFADGVPLIGFFDQLHFRGTYIDKYGQLQQDPEGTGEYADNKFTSDLKWAKTDEALASATQMLGGAEFLRIKNPNLTHARLSHIYCQHEGKDAAKRTILVDLATIKKGWYERGHARMQRFKELAKLESIEQIPKENRHSPGTREDACKAWFGCAFQSNCYKSPIARLKLGIMDKVKSQLSPTTNGAVAASQVQLPKVSAMKIKDNSTPAPAPVQQSGVFAKDCVIGEMYQISQTQAGQFQGNSKEWSFFMTDAGPVKIPGSNPVGVITAPVIEAPPAVQAAPLPVPPAWSPVPPPRLDTTEGVVTQTLPPPPAVAAALATEEKPKRGPGRPKKTETVEATTSVQGAPVPNPVTVKQAEVAVQSEVGIKLHIDCVPNGPFSTLDKYIREITSRMEAEFQVVDVRCATDDKNPLAFGKWKGVMSAMIRETPPAPGNYVLLTKGNELVEPVIEALTLLLADAPGSITRAV